MSPKNQTETETQAETPDPQPADVKQSHDRLYREVSDRQKELLADDAKRGEFLEQVDKLIGEMRCLARKIGLTGEFTWLCTATKDWQAVYSSVLKIPRDVVGDVGILELSKEAPPQRPVVAKHEVDNYIRQNAYLLGQSRKLIERLREVGEMLRHPNRIHDVLASTPEEMDADWYEACTYFACDVFDGKVSFSQQLGPDAYPHLENVWLEDVKRLMAYRIWEHDGARWDPDGRQGNYLKACEQIRSLVFKGSVKAPKKSFADLKAYLTATYLGDGKLNLAEGSPARRLIAAKARRIWEHTGKANHDLENWVLAEAFVKGFYENIIPAVAKDRPDSVAAVLKALRSSGTAQHGYCIISGFEAALVIYHLNADSITKQSADSSRVI